MNPIARHLLPDNASIDAAGNVSIAGITVEDVAARFGTPVFIYDEDHLRARCHEAVAAFGADSVIYASKAFLCTAMARLVHDEGLLLDVATGGELFVALNAGVPASRCVLHGNNKSTEELRMAMDAGVRHIVVDSFDELARIEALVAQGLPSPRVQLRITPGVYVHTHEYISTGQDDSKFGFNLGNGDAAKAAERITSGDIGELVGFHCHIGSNVFAVESFAKAAEVMARDATDAAITAKVTAALAADDRLSALGIDVDTTDGRVALSGTAPDAASRDRATVLAQAVEGVVEVENRLTVRSQS